MTLPQWPLLWPPLQPPRVRRAARLGAEAGGGFGLVIRRRPPLWRYLPLLVYLLLFPALVFWVGLPHSPALLAGTLLALLLTFGLIAWLFRKPLGTVWAFRQLGAGRLRFSRAAYGVGEPFDLRYERALRWPLAQGGWVMARLSCTEIRWAQEAGEWTQDYTVLWQHEFEPVPLQAGQDMLQAAWTVPLPAGLPAAQMAGQVAGRTTSVVWLLELREEVADSIALKSDFSLPVKPARQR